MNNKYIIFDLGGVLIDWNPKYLYRKIFAEQEKMDFFLSQICTPEWNEMQDGGRSLAEGTEILLRAHPEYKYEIHAFYDRWEEMLNGSLQGSVEILRYFYEAPDYSIYALTNWSGETWPIAQSRFNFLAWFDGIVVSGQEQMKKPDAAIYRLLLERYELEAAAGIFIDDNLRNVQAAQAIGLEAIHFENPSSLRSELRAREILHL